MNLNNIRIHIRSQKHYSLTSGNNLQPPGPLPLPILPTSNGNGGGRRRKEKGLRTREGALPCDGLEDRGMGLIWIWIFVTFDQFVKETWPDQQEDNANAFFRYLYIDTWTYIYELKFLSFLVPGEVQVESDHHENHWELQTNPTIVLTNFNWQLLISRPNKRMLTPKTS